MMNRNFTDRAIATIRFYGAFLILSTYCAGHGRSQNFYLDINRLLAWLQHSNQGLVDVDCDNFVRCYRVGPDAVRFHFYWIDADLYGDKLSGYYQIFDLPVSVLTGNEDRRILVSLDQRKLHSRIIISPEAQHSITRLDPLLRHAVIRMISRGFTWGRESTVTIYPDFDQNFFFTEDTPDGNGINGGICLRKSTVRVGHRSFSRYTYEIHT